MFHSSKAKRNFRSLLSDSLSIEKRPGSYPKCIILKHATTKVSRISKPGASYYKFSKQQFFKSIYNTRELFQAYQKIWLPIGEHTKQSSYT